MKVLKFGAEWCGPCKVLNRNLKDFKECELIMYDVDKTDEELLTKYNIRNIPVTILLDDDNNEIKRWVGAFNVQELKNEIHNR